MTEQQKSRLLKKQMWVEGAIVLICVLAYTLGKQPVGKVLMLFIILQLFSIFGLIFGLRVRRKVEDRPDDKLPLNK